jgi:preprotein translocase subunit SecD
MLTRASLLLTAVAVVAGCGSTQHLHVFDLQPDRPLSASQLDNSARILDDRLERLRLHGSVQRSGNELELSLRRGPVPPALTAQGGLEFYDLEPSLSAGPSATPPQVQRGTVLVKCKSDAALCPRIGKPRRTYYYLFKTPPAMTGADIKAQGTTSAHDPQTGQPVVLIQFTDHGSRVFTYGITRKEAHRGAKRGARQHFAIVFDRDLVTFPSIDYREYPDGIPSGLGVQITGLSSAEAQTITAVLQAGQLPTGFHVVGSR